MSNLLVGKRIVSIKIGKDSQSILFILENDETLKADCYGNCCSHTWIENIELPALGFPATVIRVEELQLPGSNRNHPEYDCFPEYDCLQVYGYKITTYQGDIIIDFRNSSNGWYGGALFWNEDYGDIPIDQWNYWIDATEKFK